MSDFVKITSSDYWFKKHPEKIAGVEYETTSIMFPIQVKGTKEDVYRVTGVEKSCTQSCTVKAKQPEGLSSKKKQKVLELEAEALELELELELEL